MHSDTKRQTAGFTLVEIMIVVAIIGLLAALAMPSWVKARTAARVSRVANELRIFGAAFHQYAMDNGNFPADSHIVLPAGMTDYIKQKSWDDCALGGRYNWEGPSWVVGGSYPYAGIALENTPASLSELTDLDSLIDNGNLNTGSFRLMANSRYTYVLEE